MEQGLGKFTATESTDCFITVEGEEISIDLSATALPFEFEHPRFRGKKMNQISLSSTQRDTLHNDDVLTEIGSLPSSRHTRSFTYQFDETSIEDGETVTVFGAYDPVEKRIFGLEGSCVMFVRNWKMNETNSLQHLSSINRRSKQK